MLIKFLLGCYALIVGCGAILGHWAKRENELINSRFAEDGEDIDAKQ